MNLLNNLEKKFGSRAIRHLTAYIILTYAIGYILSMSSMFGGEGYSRILYYLTLSPSLILKGQIWRLVSWWLIPPTSLSIFTLIMLFCYYQLGTLLERTWGDFLYNVYIFFGLFMTVIGSFLLYFITGTDYGVLFSTYYVSLSIFLGFAMTYPDMELLFMFFLPVKIKYLAVIDLVYLAYEIFRAWRSGFGLPVTVMIVSSLASVIVFFLLTRRSVLTRGQKRYRKAYRSHMSGYPGGQGRGTSAQEQGRPGPSAYTPGGKKIAVHRCAICGRTELDDPDLEFRFCSKCRGNYEYCQDHLFTHTHVQ